MKIIFCILISCVFLSTTKSKENNAKQIAQNEEYLKLLVESPQLSIRCKNLLNKRQNFIETKYSLMKFKQSNDHLLRVAPVNKLVVRKKLKINEIKIAHEVKLNKFKIKNIEENIIRNGCPGLLF